MLGISNKTGRDREYSNHKRHAITENVNHCAHTQAQSPCGVNMRWIFRNKLFKSTN